MLTIISDVAVNKYLDHPEQALQDAFNELTLECGMGFLPEQVEKFVKDYDLLRNPERVASLYAKQGVLKVAFRDGRFFLASHDSDVTSNVGCSLAS